jgi:3-isopropylmalate/(R)-2-methylmalate dehydratase small subunit
MTFSGSAVVIPQDDVDTDVLFPGPFLSVTEVAEMPQYLFEGLDPSLRDQLAGPTALVVGANFGCGSSREHVPQAMRASGIQFLVGRSFARIFSRNCLNLGLPVVICPEAVDAAKPGDQLELDLSAGTLTVAGTVYEVPALPPFMRDLLDRGGLIEWVHARITSRIDSTTAVV